MKEKYREKIKNKTNSNDDGLIKEEHKKILDKVREILKVFGLGNRSGKSIEEAYHGTKKLRRLLGCSPRRYVDKPFAVHHETKTASGKCVSSEQGYTVDVQMHKNSL
jgi:hypothetical protein